MKKIKTIKIDESYNTGKDEACEPIEIKSFPGRDVDFFLRIHRHLPDDFCGDSFPFGKCNYRPDGEPINVLNDYVVELQKNPEFVKKEKEVEEAVAKRLAPHKVKGE